MLYLLLVIAKFVDNHISPDFWYYPQLEKPGSILSSKNNSEKVVRGAEEHLGPYQVMVTKKSHHRCSSRFKYTSEILLLIHKIQADMN